MALKKIKTFVPKKSDGKKKMEPANSKTKSANSKQFSKKILNDFNDNELL